MPYIKRSESEIKNILKSLVILCDSREQKNEHITSYFDDKKIAHQTCKLDSGDYSALLPAMPEYEIMQPIYFDDSIVIERKNSLSELSGSFTQSRERFENELIRLSGRGTKTFLMVEDAMGYTGIYQHAYKTQYDSKAFMATLLSFQQRYNLNVAFVCPEHSGRYVANLMYYHVREYLKGRLRQPRQVG